MMMLPEAIHTRKDLAYGNPDLFITFTSNPKWPEITEMLALIPGQKPHDRPEVGTRIFKMKLTELLDDFTKREIFGKSRAVVYVIEFQKRGLLHAHILLWLEEEWKCTTPTQIDDIISAEIPCPTDDPEGYKVVTEFMLHGPCGKGAACTVEGKCSKRFPKPFYAETIIDEDGYPVYRRRDSKVFAVKGKFTYDNKYVVPYNRYLLLRYQAHINVEWCNRSEAIKYLFKYLNKAPCEAVWRLFSFDIHYSYPSVMKLNFHLEDQNAITLHDLQNLPALLEREDIKLTMFIEWFELNKRDTTARKLTYAEIPKLYATFKEACFAYGLLNDDKEWAHAISEASFWALGPQLRDLFVTMLLFCDVSRPLKLSEQSWQILSEDILHKKCKLFKYPDLQLTDEQLKNYCLLEIEALLRSERMIVLSIASSGIASLLLPGGRTAHSRFVIPLKLMENSTCGIKQNTHLAELMQQVQLIIWDEAPMTQKDEDEETWIEIPEEFIISSVKSPIEEIMKETFPNFATKQSEEAYLKERAILTP
ncbi:uncharacterized protein Tco_0378704 [Tanacetum coccineum]